MKLYITFYKKKGKGGGEEGIRKLDTSEKSASKGGGRGGAASGRGRVKRKKKGSGGGKGGRKEGREEMHGRERKSYAREQDLRELSRAERSGVILHNDG